MNRSPLILVVDDEEKFLEIVRTRLEAGGYDVATARNEKEAIAQAEKLVPDLILMDINMPGGTGTDAALSIKQNPKLKDVKIAFLSSLKKPWPAFGTEERKSLSQELGMEDFLDKGEDMDHLAQKVQALLEKE
jgi:two-component system, OmpR family, alkaline phosphatase synthesis response regulator PhoP